VANCSTLLLLVLVLSLILNDTPCKKAYGYFALLAFLVQASLQYFFFLSKVM
jgi:hypothetical protein